MPMALCHKLRVVDGGSEDDVISVRRPRKHWNPETRVRALKIRGRHSTDIKKAAAILNLERGVFVIVRNKMMRGILSQPNVAHLVKGVYRGQPRQSGLVSVPTRDARVRTASTVIDRDGKLIYLSKLFNDSVIHS